MNEMPILGQGQPAAGDPTYYILTQWFTQQGQAGPMVVDGYAPKLHNRPSAFSPAHVPHVHALVKEALAKQGVLGAEVIIQFLWRYEVLPSPLVDLHGGSLN
jgi:hypothetical protein